MDHGDQDLVKGYLPQAGHRQHRLYKKPTGSKRRTTPPPTSSITTLVLVMRGAEEHRQSAERPKLTIDHWPRGGRAAGSRVTTSIGRVHSAFCSGADPPPNLLHHALGFGWTWSRGTQRRTNNRPSWYGLVVAAVPPPGPGLRAAGRRQDRSHSMPTAWPPRRPAASTATRNAAGRGRSRTRSHQVHHCEMRYRSGRGDRGGGDGGGDHDEGLSTRGARAL